MEKERVGKEHAGHGINSRQVDQRRGNIPGTNDCMAIVSEGSGEPGPG